MQPGMPLFLPRPAPPVAGEMLAVALDRAAATLVIIVQLDPDRLIGEGTGGRADRAAPFDDERPMGVEGVPRARVSIRPIPRSPTGDVPRCQSPQHVLEHVGLAGLEAIPTGVHIVEAQ